MDLNKYLPETPEDYMSCFRQLSALTDAALNYIEYKENWASEEDRNKTLSRLAESVEAIASLRGDIGAFSGSRPGGLVEYQKEMYATEDFLRERLVGLGYKYPACI